MDNQVFGGKGIDTPYERELIDPEIHIDLPEKTSSYQILPDTLNMIERSREFRLSKALMDYRDLLQQIQDLLSKLEQRNSTQAFKDFIMMLSSGNKTFHELLAIENQNSGYKDTSDFELYAMLFRMGKSIETRIEFLDKYFRTQLTSETDPEIIEQEEIASILEWEKTENELVEYYLQLSHEPDEDIDIEKEIQRLERKKRQYERLHNTLADTSFIHRNRYKMFVDVIEQAAMLIDNPKSLIDGEMGYFIKQLSNFNDLKAVKTHLILLFRQYKEKHQALKGKYMLIDDMKETFLSEKHYLLQRISRDSIDPIRNWLYEQSESTSRALDIFANLMVNSIERSKQQYEDSITDILKFYRKEAVFYHQQMAYIQKKEEIRLFLRIIEDLEEVNEISDEWIDEYLKVNGYRG
jgi:hypothetical protein